HPAFVPPALRASVDFREGSDHGRLWRIVPRAGGGTSPCVPGASPDFAALVAHLEHPGGWCRDTAQRLLVERHDPAAAAPLKAIIGKSANSLARVHALWTLEGIHALEIETLRTSLRDADPHVREQSARLAERRAAEFSAELAALAGDPDARVRLHAAVAL